MNCDYITNSQGRGPLHSSPLLSLSLCVMFTSGHLHLCQVIEDLKEECGKYSPSGLSAVLLVKVTPLSSPSSLLGCRGNECLCLMEHPHLEAMMWTVSI